MTAAVMVPLWDGRYWPGRAGPIPTFGFRLAPTGLATRRQLRTAGLAPGGQEPWGRIVWRRGARFAWLYRLDQAVPKRVPSPAQLAAVHTALTARMVCRYCGPVDHVVRTSTGLCGDCTATTTTQANRAADRRYPDVFGDAR